MVFEQVEEGEDELSRTRSQRDVGDIEESDSRQVQLDLLLKPYKFINRTDSLGAEVVQQASIKVPGMRRGETRFRPTPEMKILGCCNQMVHIEHLLKAIQIEFRLYSAALGK